MQVTTLKELAASGALKGKRVLIRSDLNAPRDEAGHITNEARLVASVTRHSYGPRCRRRCDGGEPLGSSDGRYCAS